MMQATCLSRSDASLAQLRSSTRLNYKLTTHRASSIRPVRVNAFFGKKKAEDDEREAMRKEQFEAQQEILKRRKNGSWQGEVKERRGKVSKYMRDPEYKKQVARRLLLHGCTNCFH